MRRRMRLLASWCVVAGLCSIAQPVAAVDYSPCESSQMRKVGLSPRIGVVPIVLVHGFVSSAGMWDHPIDSAIDTAVTPQNRSFVEQLERIPGAAVWSFDFAEHATLWVDDDNIGRALSRGVSCLSEAYGSDVILVGHSMGGLAIRQALSIGDSAEHVAGVVSFGTPHLGSVLAWLGGALSAARVNVRLESVSTLYLISNLVDLCADVFDVEACGGFRELVDAGLHSKAGEALRLGSEELARLPVYPAGLPSLSIAGQIEVVFQGGFGLFYQDLAAVRLGDVAVPASSAMALGTETVERACRVTLTSGWALSDTVREALGIALDANDERAGLMAISNPCFHNHLTHGVELTNQALGFISDLIRPRIADIPGTALAARADTITFAASFPSGSTLWQVTPTEDYLVGEVTVEGGSAVELTDIAVSPAGDLIAVSFTDLYLIDPWSAAATLIGSLGYPAANALDTGPDGAMYTTSGPNLLEVDAQTGRAQPRGSYGSGLSSSGDIAFGPDDVLYATAYLGGGGVLVRMDPETGAATIVGETLVDDIWGLSFHEGDLYGLSADTSACGSGRGQLVTIDTNTAATAFRRCLDFVPGGATNGLGR